MATKIDLAEQQLLGYVHGKKGYYLTGLIEAMGLTNNEWEKLKSQYGLNYLDDNDKKEIDDYFKLNHGK